MAVFEMEASLPEDVRKLLDEDEKVLWVGRAALKPFCLKRFGGALIAVPFLVFGAYMFRVLEVPLVPPVLAFMALWFGVLGLFIASSTVYPALLWRNLCYVVTDRRVIVRKGVIGIDYDVLDLEYVRRAYIDRGVWDRIYGTGTLVIEAVGVTPVKLYSIPNPFEAHRILQEALKRARKPLT